MSHDHETGWALIQHDWSERQDRAAPRAIVRRVLAWLADYACARKAASRSSRAW
jgi:hypothetical protein